MELGLEDGVDVNYLSEELLSVEHEMNLKQAMPMALSSVDNREDASSTSNSRNEITPRGNINGRKALKKRNRKRSNGQDLLPAHSGGYDRYTKSIIADAVASSRVDKHKTRQGLNVENLVAGAHSQPNIHLAKDLYAERLRNIRLQRSLSTSRHKLRCALQREKDARRSAVKKRTQAAKNVWKLLEIAANQTQRMPPIALAQSVPQLLNERDPVVTLRKAATNKIRSSASNLNTREYQSLKDEGKLGLRRIWHSKSKFRSKAGKESRPSSASSALGQGIDLPLRTALILESPAAKRIKHTKNLRRLNVSTMQPGHRSRRDTEWDSWNKTPSIPLPIPVYQSLHSQRSSIDSEDGSILRPSTAPLDKNRKGKSRVSTNGSLLADGTRECALRVGGAGPWANAYPGQQAKAALALTSKMATADKRSRVNGSHNISAKGTNVSTFLEQVGDSAVEYASAPNEKRANKQEDALSIRNLDASAFKGKAKKDTFQAYLDFCIDVKKAARSRRRLLSVILGSIHLAIERELAKARSRRKEEHEIESTGLALLDSGGRDSQSSRDINESAHEALNSVRPTTEEFSLTQEDLMSSSFDPLIVEPDVVEALISSWRLQGSLPKDCLQELYIRLPVQKGVLQLDLRALERAMRASVGPRGSTDPRKIVAIVKPKPKPIMSLQPPALPGSKLDGSRHYQIPKHALKMKKSRRRWDSDAFDATSLYILPLEQPPS